LKIKLGLFQQAGDTAGALALLDSMLAMPEISDETRERLVVKKALQYYSAGDKQNALGLLESAASEANKNFFVRLTLAQLTAADGKAPQAIALLQAAIPQATNHPDALVELVAALADLQCKSIGDDAALDTLEQFANNEQVPVDLRAEALLQAAMIMRDADRVRPAMLTENRAVALAKSPELTRELQRVVDAIRLRAAAKSKSESGNRP
jgi:lipopolysaccharide biosynthesis regulator YciM